MNETECEELLASVKWTEPANLISLAVLAFINVLVIVGNCLVIAAVFCSHKLRSVTNFFIVSLAVADLLVGIAVLPFSATWEVFKVWIFGDLWCRIWLAVDVWMCTASILNLCAISLDRYVAVTRPVTYPSIMSTKRAKSLIAGIWILSFVICFPPLVGWKDEHKDQSHLTHQRGNQTAVIYNIPPEPTPPPPCPWTCELTNDAGYVVYSALGSFYIPMFVMLFFYWRIYRAAVRTTRAINQGFKTTKGSKNKKGLDARFDESRMTLRMHRGRGGKSTMDCCTDNNHSALTSTSDTPLPERNAKTNKARHNRLKISYSYPSSEHLVCEGSANTRYASTSDRDGQTIDTADGGSGGGGGGSASCSCPFDETLRHFHECDSTRGNDNGGSGSGSASATPQRIKKQMGKRNIKLQVKRFRMETKAAKTLAIIVGGFIFCWLPFFTMYLVRAFCPQCIQPLLFSILFWLGYCNSAINPVIYALFSNDFRFAFKRIICKCFCRDISSYNQRGAAELMKRLTPTLTPVITRNIHHSMDQEDAEQQRPRQEHPLRAVKSMPSHSEYRR